MNAGCAGKTVEIPWEHVPYLCHTWAP